MAFEFVVPLQQADLQRGSSTNHYVVEDVSPIRQIPDKIFACKAALRTDGPSMITHHFDSFYSLLRHFNDVEQETKEDAWELLLKAQQQLLAGLSTSLDVPESQADTRGQLNTVKMLCYLLCQTTEGFEAEACKPSTDTSVRGKRGRAKSKKTTAGWEWDAERERFLQGIAHLLQLEIRRLWDPPVVEEDFVNMISCCCYRLLENPSIGRDAGTKEALFNVIGLLVKRYNHTLGASLKIIQLLQHFEHLVSPLAQGVQTIVTQYGAKNVVTEILRELGSLDPHDLALDNSGTRAYASFLVELSERIPGVMLPSISLLLCHLDGESYTMRNGVLGVLGEIVVQILSKDGLDTKARSTRDQLLDKLEDHLHDINAFTRSRVLQIWLHLCRANAIPLPRLHSVMPLVLGRLQDRSSIVRRHAVQLLSEFLTCNPFAAKLPVDELSDNLEKETLKLRAMMPEEGVSNEAADVHTRTDEMWQAMEPELATIVREYLEEEASRTEARTDDSVDISENTTMESVISSVRDLLDRSQHRQAMGLLQAAVELWPDLATLAQTSQVFSSLSDDNEGDDDGDTDNPPDPGVQLLATLKAVYLGEKPPTAPSQEDDQDVIPQLQHNVAELAEGTPPTGPIEPALVNELTKQQVLVKYLQDCVIFATHVHKALPILCELLSSKTNSDVLEAIEFFVRAHEFGLTAATEGVRRMMVLVWSKEAGVKEAVVAAYRRLYLVPQGAGTLRSRCLAIVRSLMNLTVSASLGELASLEELLVEFVRSGDVPAQAVQLLWEFFTGKHANATAGESRAALVIIGMAASADVDIVRSNVDVLVSEGLGVRGQEDFLLAKDTCLALLKMVKPGKPKVLAGEEPFRFPADHEMFSRLSTILVSGVTDLTNIQWVPLAEQAINAVYRLSEHPDLVCGGILKELAAAVLSPRRESEHDNNDGDDTLSRQDGQEPGASCPAGILSRFLAVTGHVALAQLVHLDVMVSGELKRRRNAREDAEGTKGRKGTVEESVTTEQTEDEMGLGGASAEDAEAEFIRKICEAELVTGPNLLSIIRPLLVAVCSNPVKYSEPGLRTTASLALAKFMLVSSDFCEAHLQLLFTILEKSSQPIIRANVIIALGDLTFRFPNLIEPWTPNLYARLRDPSAHVRKNTLMVLTHLILNDMVKVKGQISEMATCIVDPEERIASLAKHFFFELSKKGNAIYNVMPDMLSRLSDPESGMEQDRFKTVMRYVFAFIQKDRQAESLVEKLCHRFRATRTERQPQDIAFCLQLLNMSEKCVRRLQENFACFADKLHDADVYHCFCSILSRAKKFAKAESKVMVEDFEQKLNECHTKGVDNEAVAEKAGKASVAAAQARGNAGRSTVKKKRNGKQRRRGKPSSYDSEDEGSPDDDDFVGTPAPSHRRPGQRSRRTATTADRRAKQTPTATAPRRKIKAVVFSDEDDDDSDDVFKIPKEIPLNELIDDGDAAASNEENRDPAPTPQGKRGRKKLLSKDPTTPTCDHAPLSNHNNM